MTPKKSFNCPMTIVPAIPDVKTVVIVTAIQEVKPGVIVYGMNLIRLPK